MRVAYAAALVLVVMLAARAAGAADAGTAEVSVAEKLDRASDARGHEERHAEALKLCEEIIVSAKADPKQRADALDVLIDVYCRQKKYDGAVEAAQRLAKAVPGDAAFVLKAFMVRAELYRGELKQRDRALATLREFLQSHPDDKPRGATVRVRLAAILREDRQFEEAYAEAAKAVDLEPQNDQSVSDALTEMVEAAWSDEKADKAQKVLPPLKRLIEDRYLAKQNGWQHWNMRTRYGDCLRLLKRYDEARAYYAAQEKIDRQKRAAPDSRVEPKWAQEWCRHAAVTFDEEGRLDEALAAYERVLVDHPTSPDYWYEAQVRIADILTKKGRFEDALRAARVCLDAARDEGSVLDNVRRLAEIFKAIDTHVGRANAFINYQKYGPAGEDAKPGTADDLKDPLEAVARPGYPERERVFAEARKQAGDDADAMRFRALTYLYSGKPKEAFRCFLDAFARGSENELQTRGVEMIFTGARAVRGHTIGLEDFFEFVNYGPAGPDGKAGTGDDLADPFAPLLK